MPNGADYLVTSADTRKKKITTRRRSSAAGDNWQPIGQVAERVVTSGVSQTPRRRAIRSAERQHLSKLTATEIVDDTLRVLEDPDDEMLAAGADELVHALPVGTPPAYRRDLAGVIWRAMLYRART